MSPASLPLSRLGFGVSGPHASPAVSRGQTNRLIQEAIRLGITTFDTAPLYGDGEAEIRLGQAIAGQDRSGLVIMTKAGIPRRNQRDFSPDGLSRSIEQSLERLQTPYLDIVFLQGIASLELTDGLLSRLDQLVSDGVVRRFGVSGRGPELDPPLALEQISVVMAPVYMGMSPASSQRLTAAHASGKAVIGIEAMAAARQKPALPRTIADLWYLARRVKRGEIPTGHATHNEALGWSMSQTYVDCTLCLTTRLANLHMNARLAGLDGAPRAP